MRFFGDAVYPQITISHLSFGQKYFGLQFHNYRFFFESHFGTKCSFLSQNFFTQFLKIFTCKFNFWTIYIFVDICPSYHFTHSKTAFLDKNFDFWSKHLRFFQNFHPLFVLLKLHFHSILFCFAYFYFGLANIFPPSSSLSRPQRLCSEKYLMNRMGTILMY